LLTELVSFGEGNLLVKTAEFPELLSVPQHEHPGREGTMQVRQVLEAIIHAIKQCIDPAAVLTDDVRCDTVQSFRFGLLDAAAHQRAVGQLNVSIQEEDERCIRECGALISPH